MSRNSAFWSFVLIFGALSTSALAVPVFCSTNSPFVTGCGTETVFVFGDIDVSTDGPPRFAGGGADLYTLGPVIPGVLDLRWFGEFDRGGCCFSGSFGGTVWDLETGTPVPIYSWSAGLSWANHGGTNVTLPLNLGIPFAVSVSSSLSVYPSPSFPGPAAGELASVAAVSLHPLPEPGSLVFLLTGLGAVATRTGLRRSR